jgi:hypothetical protein
MTLWSALTGRSGSAFSRSLEGAVMRERFGWVAAQEFIRLFRFARTATALKRHQIAEGAMPPVLVSLHTQASACSTRVR